LGCWVLKAEASPANRQLPLTGGAQRLTHTQNLGWERTLVKNNEGIKITVLSAHVTGKKSPTSITIKMKQTSALALEIIIAIRPAAHTGHISLI